MALLESTALVVAATIVGLVVAAVLSVALNVDPLASFAGTMGTALAAVVVYVALAGFGALPAAFSLTTVLSVALVCAILGSFALIARIDRPGGRWGGTLRSRFLMGAPWGTLVTVAFVLSVYLVLQHGLDHWYDPVVISFRAWSYRYPLGILTSGFTHNGAGHLLGNLMGTLVLGTIAEYAWGHFPTERGGSSFGRLRTNPWIRAFVLFPGAMLVAGVVLSAFALGPVIGFSGVVFAFAGFALVRYPVVTVAATLAQSALWETYLALRDPILAVSTQPQPPSPPSWATVAIQTHGLGLLVGIAVGAYVMADRDRTPSALRVWTGVVLFAMVKQLWAVYWFRGNGDFVLFRGPGLVLVGLLGILVATAIAASDRPLLDLVPRLTPRRVSTDGGAGGDGVAAISFREVALLSLILTTGLIAGLGGASNLVTPADKPAPDDAVQVRDFEVYYAEGVTNQRVAIVNVSFYNETTRVETSGVIVQSSGRSIWQTVVSKNRLAFTGVERIRLGGIGWEETVLVTRNGWKAAGGSTAYKVYLRPPDGNRRLAFASEPATASPTISHRNVSVIPTPNAFALIVTRNNSTLGTATLPREGHSTTAAGLRFVRRGDAVYALDNGTRVKVAEKETYQ